MRLCGLACVAWIAATGCSSGGERADVCEPEPEGPYVVELPGGVSDCPAEELPKYVYVGESDCSVVTEDGCTISLADCHGGIDNGFDLFGAFEWVEPGLYRGEITFAKPAGIGSYECVGHTPSGMLWKAEAQDGGLVIINPEGRAPEPRGGDAASSGAVGDAGP